MDCKWKMVDAINFKLGMDSERCGCEAAYRVVRKDRKSDLFLCSEHTVEWMRLYYCSYALPVVKLEVA